MVLSLWNLHSIRDKKQPQYKAEDKEWAGQTVTCSSANEKAMTWGFEDLEKELKCHGEVAGVGVGPAKGRARADRHCLSNF